MPRVLARATNLRASRARDSEVIAKLASGEAFELLDVTGDDGWGIATAHGLVGYVDATLLESTQ
ncbi:SH3 domain-containing protein [Sphingomonas sp. TX0543]|uniref:SH3 domain-containing protein n=1 Tax=unclassified Sphingomonas TaxID=196159 RepID=UPI00201629E9|nr:SH3 domain-containing protein [Sphingomonas sp. 3P27F8]